MRTAVIRVLAVLSIAACSNLGPQPDTAAPPTRAVEPPPPAREIPAPAPELTAPAPDPAPTASLSPHSAPPPEPANELVVPGGPMFHCAERPIEWATPQNKNPEIVGECYRRRDTCEARNAMMKKRGVHWTPCRERERSFCFTALDLETHTIAFRCFDAKRGCEQQRADFQKRRPDGEFSDCTWTTQNEIRARSRAVARVEH